jgi:hypothetical protein
MSGSIVTTEAITLPRTKAPALPYAPLMYDSQYQDALNNILRQYFNTLDNFIAQFMATSATVGVYGAGPGADAFGRLRVSQPFTLFDSQNRYAKDNQFDELGTGGAPTSSYIGDESSVDITVNGPSQTVIRQTLRCMPYQPGKGLLVMCTFVMDPTAEVTSRVGYFNADNGVFLQKENLSEPQFVLRTDTSGTPSDARKVAQSNWNGDKLDGTGPSGITLDLTRAQILWMDFEWLGVGSVRCGFIIDGTYITCHTFNNANDIDKVYMTTAILPIRYEIRTSNTFSGSAVLKQICSTVISEGGYGQVSAPNTVRRTTIKTTIGTTLLPLLSIRLKTGRTGAIVLPHIVNVLPTSTGNYEAVLARLPDDTSLTSASWVTTDFENIEYDVSATAVTIAADQVVDQFFVSSTNQSAGVVSQLIPYNFDTQIGATIGGTSQVYVIAARLLSGVSGDAIASLTFYDLTQ